MKIEVPEHVAAAAIKALRYDGGQASFEPNVVELGKILATALQRPAAARLTAKELKAIIWAIDLVHPQKVTDADLERARPKLLNMMERELMREQGGGR